MLAKTIASLIAFLSIGTTTAVAASSWSQLPAQAESVTALNSIENVVESAQYANYSGGDWISELDTAANTASSQGSTSAVGDVVTWADGNSCYSASVPTSSSPVDVQSC